MPTDPRTIQLWTSGSSVTYRELANEQFEVKSGDEWAPATPKQTRAIKIEEIAERLADRDILCCDSSLVDDMLRAASSGELPGDMMREWDYSEVTNTEPDPSDWDLEQCREYLDDHGIDYPDDNPWPCGEDMQEERDRLIEMIETDDEDAGRFASMSLNDLKDILIRQIEEDDDRIDAWREAVRDNAESAEIYEWYRVTKYLANRLEEIGECTLSNSYGEWWGRCATGQNLIMDGVLQRVAASILDR